MGTVGDAKPFLKKMKEWGWEYVRQGAGDHVIYRLGEKQVSVRSAGEVNDHTASLVYQALGVNGDQFLAGPIDRKRLVSPSRRKIIEFLWEQPEHRVSSRSGQATAVLLPAWGSGSGGSGGSMTGLSGLLKRMEEEGQVARTVKGKKTYSISLTENGPYVQYMLANLRASKELERVTDEIERRIAEQAAKEKEEKEERERQRQQLTHEDVADILLKKVLDIISKPTEASEEVVELRRQIDQLSQTVANYRKVIDQRGRTIEGLQVQIGELKRENGILDAKVKRLDRKRPVDSRVMEVVGNVGSVESVGSVGSEKGILKKAIEESGVKL